MALKKIIVTRDSQTSRQDALKEANILKSLQHENIIGFKDMFNCKDSVYIVQEFMHCTLYEYIKVNGNLSEEIVAKILQSVAKGVQYIHS